MSKLPILGIQKLSMIDFPPYTSAIIFIGGCNFRCAYCHNSPLVFNKGTIIEEDEILKFFEERKVWNDACVITGGEPTLYKELIPFIKRLKDKNLKVKLDSNGTNPDMLKRLIEEDLIDYIAMDIKSSPKRYKEVTVLDVDINKIKESIHIIIDSGIPHEFRTTVVPQYIEKEDLKDMLNMIKGADKYVMQLFRNEGGILDNSILDKEKYKKIKYNKGELEEFKSYLESLNLVKKIEIRGG